MRSIRVIIVCGMQISFPQLGVVRFYYCGDYIDLPRSSAANLLRTVKEQCASLGIVSQ